MLADLSQKLLTETLYNSQRPMPGSNCATPGQKSMTGVFAAPETPVLPSLEACDRALSLHYGDPAHRRVSSSVQIADGVISVATRDGEEYHYPVVQGRAGGRVSPQLQLAEPSASMAARSNAAARARHTSITSTSPSSHSILQGIIDSAGADEGETVAEALEAYRNSRLTPSRIQRHRRVSGANSRSPPPALALRGEPVEDVVQASPSQAVTPSSSLLSTPRHSMQRTPPSSSRAGWGSIAAEAVLDSSVNGARGQNAAPTVAPMRMEEMGVSTPEMAEYFAESSVDAGRRRGSSWVLSNSSSASWPIFNAQVVRRRSLPENSPHLTSRNDSHALLERLMDFMEDQSASMQKLHQRMDALESTSNSLLERVKKIESSTPANAGGLHRVAAESASPSVTRTSGSLESAPPPSTRAPSKAIN
ncbi:hypothetical protein LSCM1_02565 [Leishmania martiniquensis]|uniref:Uncharacterized protein n=1 Tax=Leishmania martiniquensis TaxID=1580590 RepID=A0A836GPG0_9TRYP|nr:hypothetical protein LSCM1_02565 [Leishmania martiniquensis]